MAISVQMANDNGKTKQKDVDAHYGKNNNLILAIPYQDLQYSELLTMEEEVSRIGAALTACRADVGREKSMRGNRG